VPRFGAEYRDANLLLVDVVKHFAQQHGVTPGQIALAWLLARKPWIVPIPGTTKLSRLEENIGGAVKLSAQDMAGIEAASSRIKVEGARYPAFHETLVGR
jgi:aryl-alcohol dehydrogenase-like predicted oxidoreductase